ncbi:HlyD family type I secretion periplasmic adaptor subunit [Devosia sp. LjRoot16]|uniref:HlyD family type I secretion periplasmic adaptor subunit n=1 Tax=Devosia sp. LjRoot16 TaxID=3342271 RepID=UPI003ECD24B0
MSSDSAEAQASSSLKRHSAFAVGLTVAVVGGLGLWASLTEIAGAVVASGTVVVEGGAKRVQHQEGGIVAEILVENDELVEQGQLLLRLDGTSVEASLAVVEAQLDDMLARRSRLVAEGSNAAQMQHPSAPGWTPGQGFEAVYAEQGRLRQSRALSLEGQQAGLEEQGEQLMQQIAGLGAQRAALSTQLEVLEEEWRGLNELLDDGLTNVGRTNANKTQRAGIAGEIGRIDTDIAAARASIAEREIAHAQLRDAFQAQVLEELQQVNVSIAELLQQKIAAEDRLQRLELRAPQPGMIHESKVQTVGGVVSAGETLMLIVPANPDIVVDARVSPMDVDKVAERQEVVLHLSSLDARTTPELMASVRAISPATSVDPTTGASFYTVRISVGSEQLALLPAGTRLVPGMPADAFIETGNRTVLSYLMKPLLDQVMHTFRED